MNSDRGKIFAHTTYVQLLKDILSKNIVVTQIIKKTRTFLSSGVSRGTSRRARTAYPPFLRSTEGRLSDVQTQSDIQMIGLKGEQSQSKRNAVFPRKIERKRAFSSHYLIPSFTAGNLSYFFVLRESWLFVGRFF